MARPSSFVVSAGAQDLLNQHTTLLSQVAARRQARSDLLLSSDGSVPEPRAQASGSSARVARPKQEEEHDVIDLSNIPPSKRAKVEAFYPCYRWDEETVRNDLPARYGVTGEWGGNFVAGAEEEKRFDEYPRFVLNLSLRWEALEADSWRRTFLTGPRSCCGSRKRHSLVTLTDPCSSLSSLSSLRTQRMNHPSHPNPHLARLRYPSSLLLRSTRTCPRNLKQRHQSSRSPTRTSRPLSDRSTPHS